MKTILALAIILSVSLTAQSQSVQESETKTQILDQSYSYAYISVYGKSFTKKLKVVVDFGDTPEQIKSGQEFSEILTDKKSYAAVLNYMVDNQFYLVETRDYNQSFDGTGGTRGVAFIMKKKK